MIWLSLIVPLVKRCQHRTLEEHEAVQEAEERAHKVIARLAELGIHPSDEQGGSER